MPGFLVRKRKGKGKNSGEVTQQRRTTKRKERRGGREKKNREGEKGREEKWICGGVRLPLVT